ATLEPAALGDLHRVGGNLRGRRSEPRQYAETLDHDANWLGDSLRHCARIPVVWAHFVRQFSASRSMRHSVLPERFDDVAWANSSDWLRAGDVLWIRHVLRDHVRRVWSGSRTSLGGANRLRGNECTWSDLCLADGEPRCASPL